MSYEEQDEHIAERRAREAEYNENVERTIRVRRKAAKNYGALYFLKNPQHRRELLREVNKDESRRYYYRD